MKREKERCGQPSDGQAGGKWQLLVRPRGNDEAEGWDVGCQMSWMSCHVMLCHVPRTRQVIAGHSALVFQTEPPLAFPFFPFSNSLPAFLDRPPFPPRLSLCLCRVHWWVRLQLESSKPYAASQARRGPAADRSTPIQVVLKPPDRVRMSKVSEMLIQTERPKLQRG